MNISGERRLVSLVAQLVVSVDLVENDVMRTDRAQWFATGAAGGMKVWKYVRVGDPSPVALKL